MILLLMLAVQAMKLKEVNVRFCTSWNSIAVPRAHKIVTSSETRGLILTSLTLEKTTLSFSEIKCFPESKESSMEVLFESNSASLLSCWSE